MGNFWNLGAGRGNLAYLSQLPADWLAHLFTTMIGRGSAMKIFAFHFALLLPCIIFAPNIGKSRLFRKYSN